MFQHLIIFVPQFKEAASTYYKCNCVAKQAQKEAPRRKKKQEDNNYGDIIVYRKNIYIFHRRCTYSSYCGVNQGTLSILDDPYTQQSLLYLDYVNGCDSSVQRLRGRRYSLYTPHRCCYMPLRVKILHKYAMLPMGVHKNDLLDVSRLPNDFDLSKVLDDLLIETANAESDSGGDSAKGLVEQPCGRNAPCCSGVETQLWKLDSLNGLACKTNRTLNFYLLDSTRYSFLLKQAGVVGSQASSEPRMFIIDQFSRTHFVMEEEIEYSTIGKFCV